MNLFNNEASLKHIIRQQEKAARQAQLEHELWLLKQETPPEVDAYSRMIQSLSSFTFKRKRVGSG